MKRLLGVILFLVGIIGVVLAFAGIYFGLSAIDQIGVGLDSGLELALESLATIQDTITLTKTAVTETVNSIQTVEKTAADLSTTIGDTGPLVDQMSVVIAQEIPNSVDAIQATLVPAAEVAEQMDSTLLALSAFSLDQSFLGIPLQFDLGIDYQPEEPLGESLLAIGGSLDGVGDELRNLEPLLATNSNNVTLMSENVALISEDIATINTVIADINPLLDQYAAIFTEIENSLVQLQTDMSNYLQGAKIVLIVLMLWLAVMQTTAVVLGYEMMTGQLDKELVVYVHEGEDSKYAPNNDDEKSNDEDEKSDDADESSQENEPEEK